MAFPPFGTQHLLTLAVGFSLTALLILGGRRGGLARKWSCGILVFINLTAWPFNLYAWNSLGVNLPLDNFLPLHLCDIAAFIAGLALLLRQRTLATLTYYWGLAATIQGLITPALSHGFPTLPFFSFFLQHFAIVATALYLPLADGWRPKHPLWKCILQVYGWSLVYLVFSLIANAILGTNFGFSMHPPYNPSLIDHLGPWPWYLFSMQAIAIVAFTLLSLPFAFSKKPKPSS